jgi:hypothetical protein
MGDSNDKFGSLEARLIFYILLGIVISFAFIIIIIIIIIIRVIYSSHSVV